MSKKTLIPIGPYHPLQEEPELFKLFCDGEIVRDIKFETGYNHRGIEKLSESKTYEQIFFLVERICGICSNSHPFAFANAVEEIADIEITDRAKYIRTIIGELERIHSHLLWVGLAGHFLGYNTVFMWAWKYREPVLDLFEMISGNRNSYAMFKVGGVRRDIEENKIPVIRTVLDDIKKKTDLLTGAVMDDPVIHARTKGVGVLTRQDIIDYGAVGPTARASGVAIDVRMDDPYAAYPLVNWKVITARAGDVFAKAEVRLLEMYESVSIIEQCLDGLNKEKGEILQLKSRKYQKESAMVVRKLRAGKSSIFVQSDGSNSPVRHKIRAPSYVNIATFKKSCIGQTIADATISLAAVDPCYCCTERMAIACDAKTGEKMMNAAELINESVKRTDEVKKLLNNKV